MYRAAAVAAVGVAFACQRLGQTGQRRERKGGEGGKRERILDVLLREHHCLDAPRVRLQQLLLQSADRQNF